MWLLMWSLLVGCDNTKQDVVTHSGGWASVTLTPVQGGEGLRATGHVEDNPQVVGICSSSMREAQFRTGDTELRTSISLCMELELEGNRCFDRATVELFISESDTLLFVKNAAGYTDERDSVTLDVHDVQGTVVSRDGFFLGRVTMDSPCYDDVHEVDINASWDFPFVTEEVWGKNQLDSINLAGA